MPAGSCARDFDGVKDAMFPEFDIACVGIGGWEPTCEDGICIGTCSR